MDLSQNQIYEEQKGEPSTILEHQQIVEYKQKVHDLSQQLVKEMFEKQFPRIIQVVIQYAPIIKEEYKKLVRDINDKILAMVLSQLRNKQESNHIFKCLKDQLKVSVKEQKKEIIVVWLYELFSEFEEQFIDEHNEVFESLISTIDFSQHDLLIKTLELLCMASKKNEKHLRAIIEKIIKKFQASQDVLSQSKMNQIIQVLCTSMYPEKVILEFALVLKQQEDLDFKANLVDNLT